MFSDSYLERFVSLSLIIVAVWALGGVLVPLGFRDPASFGDQFGGISSLFSGLAFAGLIITLLMQMEELRLQRDEFILARKAQEAQARWLKQEVENQKTELAHARETTLYANEPVVTLRPTTGKRSSFRNAKVSLTVQILGPHAAVDLCIQKGTKANYLAHVIRYGLLGPGEAKNFEIADYDEYTSPLVITYRNQAGGWFCSTWAVRHDATECFDLRRVDRPKE